MIIRKHNGRKVYASAELDIMSASMRIEHGKATGKVRALTVKLGPTDDCPTAVEFTVTVEELATMNEWVARVERNQPAYLTHRRFADD